MSTTIEMESECKAFTIFHRCDFFFQIKIDFLAIMCQVAHSVSLWKSVPIGHVQPMALTTVQLCKKGLR